MKHSTMSRSLYLLFFTLLSFSATAASVVPLGLARMHGDADLVFVGRCIDSQVRFDASTQMPATYTTFEVQEVVKGEAARTHTIKQVGGDIPGSDADVVVDGVPEFEPGRRYVVFLPTVSRFGFSSPVGLAQGSFALRTENGKEMVSNGRTVEELLADLPQGVRETAASASADSHTHKTTERFGGQRDALPLDEFLTIVRGL